MDIMGCRFETLHYIIQAFNKTSIPLVLFKNNTFQPFCAYDDIGIYILIPKIVQCFSLTLPLALNFFFYGLLVWAFFSALLGFYCLYKETLLRLVAVIGLSFLMAFIIKSKIFDVYVCYATSCLALIPLFLYFINKKRSSYFFIIFTFYAGLVIGCFHYIRCWSSLAALSCIILMLTMHRSNLKDKSKLFLSLLCGLLIPIGYFNYQISQYNEFAQTHFPSTHYLKIGHPLWHSAYIGLGYLKFGNPDNIRYRDICAEQKVFQVNPNITIQETSLYENILKDEIWNLLNTKTFFVFATIFAKIGVLLFYLLLFMNIGIIFLYLTPLDKPLLIAFVSMLGINSIFPIIAIPAFEYSIGFITVALLFGIISLCNALPFILSFLTTKLTKRKYIWS